MSAVLDYLPRGNTLSDEEWHRRHRLLQWLLAAHLPGLFVYGVLRGYLPSDVAETLAIPLACLIVGHLMRSRRLAAGFITLGLVYCSAALVGFSGGAIEAHFHFFIIIGFIALYQDWVPFLLNILFTVLSHGVGSSFVPDLMFNHVSGQQHPWEWSLIHGLAVLAACVGVVLFWKNTEDEQQRSLTLTQQLADAEISRRRFTSDLLVNLARRNQNLLYRQLDLLNELEDKERDPDALADLFQLDHLATRIRRNAESLLVLSGEDSPRTWREPVPLVDVLRAAIAEIEDLDRVDESLDETLAVSGRSVADLTHLFAELLENAVHFSPPGVTVVVRSRPVPSSPGAHVVTIEDWGVGMGPAELAAANEILRAPREVDLSVSQRLGLHVVARLAHRYGIRVELTPTPGGGVTAVAVLPPSIFERSAELVGAAAGAAPAPRGAAGVATRGLEHAGASTFGFDPVPRAGVPGAGDAVTAANGAGVAAGAVLPVRPPGRPTPPLPPDPVDEVGPLPRRDPGGSLPRPARHSAPPSSETGPGDGAGSAQPLHPATPGEGAARWRRHDPPQSPREQDAGPYASPPDGAGQEQAARYGAPHYGATRYGATLSGSADDLAAPHGAAQAGAPLPGSAATGPAATGPAATGPAATGPAATGPAATEPAATEPAATEPAATGPAANGGAATSGAADGAGQNVVAPDGAAQAGAPLNGAATNGAATNGAATNGAVQNGAWRNRTTYDWSGSLEATPSEDGWSSWWTRATPSARRPQPRLGPQPEPGLDPRPDPELAEAPEPGPDRLAEAEPNGSTPTPEPHAATDTPQLRRRVPQANLAAGLRRDAGVAAAGEDSPMVRDPMAARNALSRFQAAQRAARDAVEADRDDGGPP